MKLKLLAQKIPLGDIGGDQGFGPWGSVADRGKEVGYAAGAFTDTISRIIGIMTIIAGIWFIFQFMIAAFGFLTAGGNQESLSKATSKLTSALLGLVVVVAAYMIFSLLSALLGFDFLKPAELIELLSP